MSMKLTKCCSANIVTKHDREYPDPNSYFSIAVSWPECEDCGEEHPETYDACDCCGEREGTIPTELGDWCEQCVDKEAKVG